MTYPTAPALNQSEAEYPELWDGLVFAYLPGYNKNTPIVGGGTMGGSTTTTIDNYAEGDGETIQLGQYRQATATPLEGTTAATIHAYYRMLWANDVTASGIIGTAPTKIWINIGQLVIGDAAGTLRGVWKRSGDEVLVTSNFVNHNSTTNPVVNAVTWRDASVAGIHDFLTTATTVSASSIAGAITSSEPLIIGSYYDKSPERSSNIAFFCGAFWNRVLTVAERSLLAADPYAVFQKAVAGPATFSFSTTTALPTFSGSASVAGASPVASFTTTTALPVFSGSASVAGAGATITINDLRDLTTGTLRVSETGLTAIINNISTGALVVLLTGQILTAGGDLILTHASLVPGTWYRVTVILSDGSEGTWKYQAA